jgi:hypothetical protein
MKVKTYGGEEFELEGQSVQEYIAWRNAYINLIGQVLTAKFPEFCGRIEFNIYKGKLVNSNMVDGIKGELVDSKTLNKAIEFFDDLLKQRTEGVGVSQEKLAK